MKFSTRFSQKILSLSLVFSLTSVVASTSTSLEELKPLGKHYRTTAEIVSRLSQQHYQRSAVHIDNELSSTVYNRFIKELDGNHSYFIQSDIDDFEKYRYLLDDAFRAKKVDPAFIIFNRYQQRVSERLEYLLATIKKGIDKLDFSTDQSFFIDRENHAWPKDIAELNTLWHKRLVNSVLNLKLSDKKEDKITELLTKRYSSQLKRIQQNNSEDAYRVYMNALTLSYDPHTQYFSPRGTENFNIRMRLSLQGIGAMLQSDDDYTKVTRLIPAGPADKAGELQANDRITGVGQGAKGEIVDVIGWRLDDVVDLIRGKKGSVVRLSILKNNAIDTSKNQVISITRDKVNLDEQDASKQIIELENYGRKYRLGVIDIPKFYIDFDAANRGEPNYKSTTRDVKKLIAELKTEKVDGIIIDLRDNGGGSLHEVNTLIGLFIKSGPTVQVKDMTGRIYISTDKDEQTSYNGPLAVLVNRISASASEIFAGAIQDYHRGIIVGTQTYGKGTVQAMLPLSSGQITLTQQKFYRITGGSTQNRGVIPDINLPSLYNVAEVGESTLEAALPWDKIKAASFNAFEDFSLKIPKLQSLHDSRISKDPDFIHLTKTNKLIEERRQIKEISLNEKTRRKEKKELETIQISLENDRRKALGLKLIKNLDEFNKSIGNVDDDDQNAKEEKKKDGPTPLLTETGHILVDYLNLMHPGVADRNTNNNDSI
ncbi:Tail-specific protease precursor [hydrothermal vent metagenome]|uniref:Tail-specific protease n=1 Tax=hydrothermal vent metagenome TaxID=652676 RepID=A0A3B0WW30_9ZZZZ